MFDYFDDSDDDLDYLSYLSYEDELMIEAMFDPSQYMFWDKEDRPYNNPAWVDKLMRKLQAMQTSDLMKSKKRRKQQSKSRSTVPCKFYVRGACTKGDTCPFLHDPSTVKRKVLCRFFNTSGGCRYGDSCRFVHEKSDDASVPKFWADEEFADCFCCCLSSFRSGVSLSFQNN